ncbi:outer membrane beta-barrel protein [Hymenobacter humi]|uniref:Outer membrane beta-barrel protein n=1 Tax=Hymenobacter humi TaxID=1411620 RepID=A0ABW2U9M1_9BACT
MLGAGLNEARATDLTSRPVLKDTIVVRLPNQATITLVVRDAAQLRQMKNYQLDSLTSRLASYITQAEKAAQSASTDQVTVQFYPDKDQPGKNLPEQIRITTRKKKANTNRVDVMLNKTFGVSVTTDENGNKSYGSMETKSKEQRQAQRDSNRVKALQRKSSSINLIMDVGLNALVNQKPNVGLGQTGNVDLRTAGSRYINLGFDSETRLGGKRSPVSLIVGPEFSFNNFMLSGNNKWVNADGVTTVVKETDGRQFEKSKLTTSSVNLPLMLQLKLHDSHGKSTFHLGAGGFVGYRLGSHTKLKYISEGNVYKDKDEGSYNLENFLYGAQGTIGYGSLQLFAKYNMNELFKTNAGPSAQVLSFGLRIFGN